MTDVDPEGLRTRLPPCDEERALADLLVKEYAGRLAPAFVRTVVLRWRTPTRGELDWHATSEAVRHRLDAWLANLTYPL
jgi:hypothetical protein